MIVLDDAFLCDVGLAEMPESQRLAFLQHIYEELELRVGTRLSEDLSELQLMEFESLIDRDIAAATVWLESAVPDYLTDPMYEAMVEQLASAPAEVVLCEYAATKWLGVNRPDYQELVAVEFDRMKGELRAHAEDLRATFHR